MAHLSTALSSVNTISAAMADMGARLFADLNANGRNLFAAYYADAFREALYQAAEPSFKRYDDAGELVSLDAMDMNGNYFYLARLGPSRFVVTSAKGCSTIYKALYELHLGAWVRDMNLDVLETGLVAWLARQAGVEVKVSDNRRGYAEADGLNRAATYAVQDRNGMQYMYVQFEYGMTHPMFTSRNIFDCIELCKGC